MCAPVGSNGRLCLYAGTLHQDTIILMAGRCEQRESNFRVGNDMVENCPMRGGVMAKESCRHSDAYMISKSAMFV
jgi:hypothetical protein